MRGGVKIQTGKEATRFSPIQNLPVPEEVVLYASQHIGAPSDIIVKKRQNVKKGEAVAIPRGDCSAALHSPVTGVVKDVSTLNRCGGQVSMAVVIKKTPEGREESDFMEPLSFPTAEKIKERIKDAGIIGMGGAGFPTHMKLSPPEPVEIAFLNGCECEPMLTADERVMIEESSKVAEGFNFLMKASGVQKGIIAIEDDKSLAVEKMREAAAGYGNMKVKVLEKVYPQGYEKMIITKTTGRQVPPGRLPFDTGAIVHNVSTCLAVAEAVTEGKPLIERVVTVAGEGVAEPVNYRLPLGITVREVLGYSSLRLSGSGADIYMGGPMMGVSLDSLDFGVLKTTSGIIVQEPFIREPVPCIKCGRCVDACPMGLYPQRFNMFYGADEFESMSDAGLQSCMECGCCSYACPSQIPLTEKFKEAKKHL